MRGFLSGKTVMAVLVISVILATAILAPMFIPEQASTQMNMRARLLPPSSDYLLGTDHLGRDLFYRVILGARLSMMIAVTAVLMSILIGLPIGVISGYFGGHVDNVLMRLVDTFLSFPVLLLALTISAVLGPSLQNTIIAIGIAFTPFLARIIRGEVLRVAEMPYVEAARASGTTDLFMILRHVLPNILPPVIVQSTISLAFAILAEAGLSFLGLGTQPPQASWGLMIQTSRDYLDVAPWTALVPGAAIGITVLALNILGDALRDALDPRARR
ncbi:MAG: ABC transporter permease [Gemmobacter sp.]|jgi:peptide/nickel transport system permease protein|nr:ABC transporter permease [Gemmobacter sp.]